MKFLIYLFLLGFTLPAYAKNFKVTLSHVFIRDNLGIITISLPITLSDNNEVSGKLKGQADTLLEDKELNKDFTSSKEGDTRELRQFLISTFCSKEYTNKEVQFKYGTSSSPIILPSNNLTVKNRVIDFSYSYTTKWGDNRSDINFLICPATN